MNKIYFLLFILLLLFSNSYTQENIETVAYITSYNGLVLRSGPSLTSSKITLIPYQSRIDIIKKSNPCKINEITSYWYYVNFLNKLGYVFGGYISFLEPKIINSNNYELIKQYFDSAEKGFCYYNNKIILGMIKSEAIKIIGKPKLIDYWSGAELLIYDKFSLTIPLAPNNISEDSKNITGIVYNITQYKFTLQELINSIDNPNSVDYNVHDGIWDIRYLRYKTNITFTAHDLNDYIKTMIIYIKK